MTDLWFILNLILDIYIFLLYQVQITSQTQSQIPFGVGLASDPMAIRRGGRKLPMEDVCYYHWPLAGVDQVWKHFLLTIL